MIEDDSNREKSAWNLVVDFLSTLIENSVDFTVFQICSGKTDSAEPYVQTLLEEEGRLRLECISNEYLDPPMSRESETRLEQLGWLPPIKDDDLTNFFRYVDLEHESIRSAADFLITTLREIFAIDLSDSVVCDASDEALKAVRRKFRLDSRECFTLRDQFYR